MIFRLYSYNTVINVKINDKIAASSDIAQCSDRCIERLVPTAGNTLGPPRHNWRHVQDC